MNRLRRLNATAANRSVISTPETFINSTEENNQQEQAILLTEDEGNELETCAELKDAFSTERIMLQLQLMDKNKLERAKKIWNLFKTQSES